MLSLLLLFAIFIVCWLQCVDTGWCVRCCFVVVASVLFVCLFVCFFVCCWFLIVVLLLFLLLSLSLLSLLLSLVVVAVTDYRVLVSSF